MTILPLTYLCGNIYILIKLWFCLGKTSFKIGSNSWQMPLWVKIAIMAIMAVVASSLFISIGIRNSDVPFWIMKLMHTAGSVWMLFIFYLIIILFPTDVARLTIPPLKRARWFSSTKMFWGASAIVTLILAGGYINYINPQIVKLDIAVKESGIQKTPERVPATKSDDIKIIAISDVHLGYGTGKWLTRRYVEKINALKPDMVLIAGDLIDNSTKPVAHQQLHLELNNIKAPLGVYLVPGNHEYISGIDQCKELLAQTQVKVLQDSVISIPQAQGTLQIIGRDDRANRNRKSLEELHAQASGDDTTAAIDENITTIVVDHQPYNLAQTDSLGIDLQISGHTHRGQIWPFNLLTDKMYEQSHGYRKWSNSHIYVSTGLSLWGPPFRIGTRSEIGVIKIVLK